MKTKPQTVGLLVGEGDAPTKAICRALAKEGIAAIVRKTDAKPIETDDLAEHWSGEPGQDLFFNGWKLLF